jgi:hypothetical protein
MIRTEAISFSYSHIAHPETVPVPGDSVARHSLIVALPRWVRPSGLRRDANNTAGSKPGEGDEQPLHGALPIRAPVLRNVEAPTARQVLTWKSNAVKRHKSCRASPAARLE